MNNARSWSARAAEVARSYTANTSELAWRKGYNRIKRSPVLPRTRGVSKPAEAAAISIASDHRIQELEREVEAVEWAFEELKKVKDSEEISKLAETLYLTRYRVDIKRVAYQMNITKSTAYRYNRIFLKLVAARMGLWAPQE